MTTRGHLWAVGYESIGQADRVRQRGVARLAANHCLEVLESAVAVRYPDGSCTTRRRGVHGRRRRGGQALWRAACSHLLRCVRRR